MIRLLVVLLAAFVICAAAFPEERKATPVEEAVGAAQKQFQKLKDDSASPAEKLRAELAMEALAKLPREINVMTFDQAKGARFDEGLLQYSVTSVKQTREGGFGLVFAFSILNSAEESASIPEVVKRLESAALGNNHPRTTPRTDGKLTMLGKGGLPAKGTISMERAFPGASAETPLKELYLDFPGDKNRPFTRIIVPCDAVQKK